MLHVCPTWSRYGECYTFYVSIRTLYGVFTRTKPANELWDCVSLVKTIEVCLKSLQDVGPRVTSCCSCGIYERMLCRCGKLQRQLQWQRNKMPVSSFLPSSQLCQCLLPNGQKQKQRAKEPIMVFAGPAFPICWEHDHCHGHPTCALTQGSTLKRALGFMLPCHCLEI